MTRPSEPLEEKAFRSAESGEAASRMTRPSEPRLPGAVFPLLAGFCSLIIAMGIGRFVYTPLLPGMMEAHGFGEVLAGEIAGWNYVGYLVGAFAMRGVATPLARYRVFALTLVTSIATTALTGVLHGESAWIALRFLAGVASGGIFVLCSAMVFDRLAELRAAALAGFLYSGVGSGIALGGLAAPFLERIFDNNGAWIGSGVLCLPLAVLALVCLYPEPAKGVRPKARTVERPAGKGDFPRTAGLLAAYFCEGLGYIMSATFLVTMIYTATGSLPLANASWVLAGVAAAVSAPLWALLARRTGYLPALLGVFCLQGLGILLPVVSGSATAALCGGVLFGGTFIGVTVLSLQYAVALSSMPSSRVIATMTGVYGAGQIIGPFAAAALAAKGYGFTLSFALSAGCVFLGALFLLLSHLPRRSRRPG